MWPAGHTTVEVAGSRVNLGEVQLSANYDGTVSHDAFGAAYFDEDCPHTSSPTPAP